VGVGLVLVALILPLFYSLYIWKTREAGQAEESS
jgi:hypothetical protein